MTRIVRLSADERARIAEQYGCASVPETVTVCPLGASSEPSDYRWNGYALVCVDPEAAASRHKRRMWSGASAAQARPVVQDPRLPGWVEAGRSATWIARTLGCHTERVWRMASAAGLHDELRQNGLAAMRSNGRSRAVTDDREARIRAMLAAGHRQSEIRRALRCGSSTITRIAREAAGQDAGSRVEARGIGLARKKTGTQRPAVSLSGAFGKAGEEGDG